MPRIEWQCAYGANTAIWIHVPRHFIRLLNRCHRGGSAVNNDLRRYEFEFLPSIGLWELIAAVSV